MPTDHSIRPFLLLKNYIFGGLAQWHTILTLSLLYTAPPLLPLLAYGQEKVVEDGLNPQTFALQWETWKKLLVPSFGLASLLVE